jgi:hypothetical protein
MRKLVLTTTAAVTLACTASAASPANAQREGSNYMSGLFDRRMNQNIGPGGPCPINLKCGKNTRPLDPNAPLYRPTYTPQQAKARKRMEELTR